MSRLLCFQRGPQQQLQCVHVNTLLSKGPKVTVMYEHFSFKGSPISLILVFHFPIWTVEACFGELSGYGTEFWAPVTAWAPNCGYGVRLIWLWSYIYDTLQCRI